MDLYARVKRLEGAHAVVALAQERGGCGRCSEAGGCRSGVLGQMFCASPREFSLPNGIDARAGERVIVRLAAGSLARFSVAAYLIPVVAVLIGGAFGAAFAGDLFARDGGAIAGSLLGLVVAVCLIAFRLGPAAVGSGPRLVRIGGEVPKCRTEERP